MNNNDYNLKSLQRRYECLRMKAIIHSEINREIQHQKELLMKHEYIDLVAKIEKNFGLW